MRTKREKCEIPSWTFKSTRRSCSTSARDCNAWSASLRRAMGLYALQIPAVGSFDCTMTARKRSLRRRSHRTFSNADNEATRYLTGTLPNGLAFAANGDILISNYGTDWLEVMTRSVESKVLAGGIDGEAIGKVNFVLRDSKGRIWITISTRIKNWMRVKAGSP